MVCPWGSPTQRNTAGSGCRKPRLWPPPTREGDGRREEESGKKGERVRRGGGRWETRRGERKEGEYWEGERGEGREGRHEGIEGGRK